MPPDLRRLYAQEELLGSIFEVLDLDLLSEGNRDGDWDEVSDTSYLSEAERADPDIASNVEAMAETNALITWFARGPEGFLGLWRGPSERALERAPVVQLDTEGQYSIVAVSIPDALAASALEEDFDFVRGELLAAGFQVAASIDAIHAACDALEGQRPNAHRNELYERKREARGLPRTDG